jgi:hypothetical protein
MVDNIIGIATGQGLAHRRRLRGLERYLERARLDLERDSA